MIYNYYMNNYKIKNHIILKNKIKSSKSNLLYWIFYCRKKPKQSEEEEVEHIKRSGKPKKQHYIAKQQVLKTSE